MTLGFACQASRRSEETCLIVRDGGSGLVGLLALSLGDRDQICLLELVAPEGLDPGGGIRLGC